MKREISNMPETIDVVVDMQNDFVTGSLGTKEAQLIAPTVIETVNAAIAAGHGIVFTQDTHAKDYLTSREGKELPIPHCIYSTPGWELIPGIDEVSKEFGNLYALSKPTFGAALLPKFLDMRFHEAFEKHRVKRFRVYGLCTGICVISNAVILRAAYPEIDIEILKDCCACVTPESHKNAIQTMKTLQMHVK